MNNLPNAKWPTEQPGNEEFVREGEDIGAGGSIKTTGLKQVVLVQQQQR